MKVYTIFKHRDSDSETNNDELIDIKSTEEAASSLVDFLRSREENRNVSYFYAKYPISDESHLLYRRYNADSQAELISSCPTEESARGDIDEVEVEYGSVFFIVKAPSV